MNGFPVIDLSEFAPAFGWSIGIMGITVSAANVVLEVCHQGLKVIGKLFSALRQIIESLPLTDAQKQTALATLNSKQNEITQRVIQGCKEGKPVAGQCTVSHTARVPGAGLCCKHVGTALKNPGDHISVTTSKGECGTCWLMAAGERVGKGGVATPDPRFKHMHLQFTRGLGTCAAHKTGCCALQAMLAAGTARGLAL